MSSLVSKLTNLARSQHLITCSFSTGKPLCKGKAKADVVLVATKSVVSGHFRHMRRARLGDKVEFLAFDPWIQKEVIYREVEKIKSVRDDPENWYAQPSELKTPDFYEINKK